NGYGELMLRWAFAYYSSIGRKSLELNVDTGNESGALRLYEKLGFKVKSAWQHFENKAWANL
ncbi:MAG: GNAT family N-acetyltransferase, partial [Candidatus Nanopelagicaceae bacterium]